MCELDLREANFGYGGYNCNGKLVCRTVFCSNNYLSIHSLICHSSICPPVSILSLYSFTHPSFINLSTSLNSISLFNQPFIRPPVCQTVLCLFHISLFIHLFIIQTVICLHPPSLYLFIQLFIAPSASLYYIYSTISLFTHPQIHFFPPVYSVRLTVSLFIHQLILLSVPPIYSVRLAVCLIILPLSF